MVDKQAGGARAQTNELDVTELLDMVRQLALELHPRRKRSQKVSLESSLDRELGFDSLSRVELLLRLQRRFGVNLPERLFASAETPRDLWEALGEADSATRRGPSDRALREAPQALDSEPVAATTLLEVLEWHVARHPDRPQVYLYQDGFEPQTITCARLLEGARAIAAGLQAYGLLPGQAVCIMLPTSAEYLYSFFGILQAGGVPVPIYPPVRASQIEDHLRRHFGILENAQTVLLITDPDARRVAGLLKAQVTSLREVVTAEELTDAGETFSQPVVKADAVAFLQYTSGSTGQPKGVILTHANLMANIRAMGEAVQADSTDVFVSWLPLYHDMGLIGAWLASLYFGMPLVLMSPLAFLTRPARWLWAIHEHRGTLTAAPNFAYELALSKIDPGELEGLDLGSLRMAFNGAEPVSPNTLRRFTEQFARFGLGPRALAPVYGLAESAVGLAFPPVDRGPLVDRIQRKMFESTGRAVPAVAADGQSQVLEFAACGQPLPGYQIRIVDTAGRELPNRREGRLEFQGPSATRGYMRNPEATERLFDGDWLDSGDLAYIAAGDVYLTRRVKDIIIRGGRNIYPYEVEEAVGDVPGIRKGCVAVFGSPDPESGTERVIVVAETRETDTVAKEVIRGAVDGIATDRLDMPPDEVVIAPPHSVLKTSSGKIRRAAVRELFEQGRLGEQPRTVWWQVVRLTLGSWQPRLKDVRQRFTATAYAGYSYLMLGLVALPVWVLVALLPHLAWRFRAARGGARILLRLARIPLHVEHLVQGELDEPCVIVANHSSYLDGVILMCALPATDFAFVAKGELNRQFIAGRFLRGIGVAFVERVDVERGVADAEHTAAIARDGRSMVFFPEGTFTRMPGLLPFRLGAFTVATDVGIPVVPVIIQGTRSLLRSESWFPRRGAVRVTVGEALRSEGRDWPAVLKLRDAARASILRQLDEPDLAGVDVPVPGDSAASAG